MATIDECKKRVEHLAGKNGYNGYISPDEFNSAWGSAERRLYSTRYNEFLRNEKNSDSLSVHMSDPTPMLIDGQGRYAVSDEIKHINAISHIYNGKSWPVERVEADRVANRLNSQYDAPDSQFPIYTKYKSFLQFYPMDLANGSIVFLKKLVPGKWAYTIDDKNRAVYNASLSVQPLWNDDDIDKLIYMVLSDIGVVMNDGPLQQSSERKIQTEL